MKKGSVFIILFISCFTFFSTAGEVSKKDVRKVANNFYFERNFNDTFLNYDNDFIGNLYLVEIHSKPAFWFVNFKESGWVAISAQNAVIPIIAYSPNGRYNPDYQPSNFKAWIGQYRSQIFEVIENNKKPEHDINEQWNHYLADDPTLFENYKLGRSMDPLVVTTWDQGIYYNEMCPPDAGGPGGHCLTGCVPTCMGQIANYFRWPQTGIGSYSYDGGAYGTLSANFGESTYNWNEMPSSVTQNSLETAQILYHFGVSCDLVYGPNGSGMYNHKAAYSLRTYFKYSPATEYLYRDSTNLNWDSVIIAHLDQKIPLYYAGWSVPNINGHAFVCDGYQNDNYFHFNWGWSGSYDGYFYTGSLNPGGNNFNLAQELIINCFPDTSLYSYPVYCNGADTVNSNSGTLDDGSGPIYDYFENQSCSWLISPTDSVQSITLHFYNFNVADGDILYVYDGNSENSELLAMLTGSTVPDNITSSGDEMFIKFETDNQTNASGWLVGYSSELPIFCSNNVLTEPTGSISDGSGPADYQNLTTCIWMIQPPVYGEILLDFEEFNTEADHDFVTVYDGSDKIGEFSGNELPPQLSALSGMMTIVFSTNSSITDKGWSANYTRIIVNEEEVEENGNFAIYPNPANNTLNIVGSDSGAITNIRIFNLMGNIIFHSDSSVEAINIIDTSRFKNGIYFVEISGAKGKFTSRIIVNH